MSESDAETFPEKNRKARRKEQREKGKERERDFCPLACIHKYSQWKELAQDKASGQNSIQVAHTDGMDPQTQTII